MIRWGVTICLLASLLSRGAESTPHEHGGDMMGNGGGGMGHGAGGRNKGVPPPPQPSSCVVADFEVLADFDVQRYVGTWFTVAHTGDMSNAYHRRSHYSLSDEGGLTMATRRVSRQNGCETSAEFQADGSVADGSTTSSKLLLQPRVLGVPPEDYWVIYTDYTDHALVYSCSLVRDDGVCEAGSDHVWLLGRAGALSDGARHHMMSLLTGLCVDASRVTDVPTECDTELGVPTSTQPHGHHEMPSSSCIVSDIQTMSGFDKSQYNGTWFVVSQLQADVYPYHRVSNYVLTPAGSFKMLTHRITGPNSCSSAWKFEGEAYIPEDAETDSKLVLKPFGMPVYGEDYWVIYTDYTDHALVYSCTGRGDDGSCSEGARHAWLMSRNPTLTPAARAHMEMLLTEMCVDPAGLVDTPDECDEVLGAESLVDQGPSNDCVVHSFETMPEFDKSRYEGTWYVVSHVAESVYPFQRISHYTLEEDGTLTMATDRITGPELCESAWHFEARAHEPEGSTSASKMLLTPVGMDVVGEDYWIIYTDYTDHSLIYSCSVKNLDGTCQEGAAHAWLMGRRPQLSDIAHSHLVSLLKDVCVDPMLLIETSTECDESLGVARASRCDMEKFAVMENFDMSQYLGSWYVVSSVRDTLYPYHRISHYTARGGAAITMATDRINGPGECTTVEHFEAKGFVRDQSTSSKLILKPVGIPAAGEDYWVVYVNYTDHALVYSCNERNLDGTCAEGVANAYMLSRQATLSPGAREHMEMLLQDVCIDPTTMIDTPSECDEVLQMGIRRPVVELGSSSCVVDDLPVMDDFDITQYAGVWYTVSQIQPFAFPFHRVSNYTLQENGRLLMSTDQFLRPGDCSTMHFDAEAFHMEQEGETVEETRSGKLFLQPLDARVPPGNYWVVYTDYLDHALVYSCVQKNQDGTCKRGFSMAWFMSRNPFLSKAAMDHMRILLRQMCVKPSKLRDVVTECDESIGIHAEPVESACAISSLEVKQDFVIDKFLGDWFELSHTAGRRHMMVPDNEKMTISRAAEGTSADISITMKNIRLNGVCYHKDMPGLGWLGEAEPAKIVVSFPLIPAGYELPEVVNHWVLDTDYDNYAVTYTCHRVNRDGSCDPAAQGLWILGRERQILPEFWATVQAIITRACVDFSAVQPNPAPCPSDEPQPEEPVEERSCAASEFGCCLLSDDAAADAEYSNCPRVPPPVAGRDIPAAPVSIVEGKVLCGLRINCKIFCRFGFQLNSDGCEICECAAQPHIETSEHGGHGPAATGACQVRYDTIMAKLKNQSPRPGFYIPQCDARGRYALLQCLYPREACWCADPETGTSLRKATYNGDTPSCDP